MSTNPICVWDVTVSLWCVPAGMCHKTLPPAQVNHLNEVISTCKKMLRQHCKKWAFQVEVGTSARRLHLQARFSLKLKQRLAQVRLLFPEQWRNRAHLSPTSKENSSNTFYVLKEDTRFFGPFSDTDVELPRQLIPFERSLLPWQDSLRKLILHWDPRVIHVVVTEGNIGKTSLMGLMLVWKEAAFVPLMSTYKDLMRAVMDQEKKPAYIVDIPRAFKTGTELWAALESVKSGYAFDDRYNFRWALFDSPGIVVFTNMEPPHGHLSEDRWVIWGVQNNRLVQTFGDTHPYFSQYLN